MRLGWLRPLPSRGTYEFLSARGGPYSGGDPLVEARAVRKNRPDFRLAVVGSGATFLRGFSERAPNQYVIAADKRQGGSVALNAAAVVARDPALGAEDLGLLSRDAVDVSVMLRSIEVTDTRIGVPTGPDETRLATCPCADPCRARTRYAERAAELRAQERPDAQKPGGQSSDLPQCSAMALRWRVWNARMTYTSAA